MKTKGRAPNASTVLRVGITLAVMIAAACSDSGAGPPEPAAIVSTGQVPATVTVASVVNIAVRVNDSNGNGIPGTNIAFTVTGGGGSVASPSVETGDGGVATIAWTLGTAVGPNTLVASVGSLDQTTTIAATAGPAHALVAVSATALGGTAGTAVGIIPSVRVDDEFGNVRAGVSVTFAVASGNGSVTGATQTTNDDGIAAVGSWTLGSNAGENTLHATAVGVDGAPVVFTATGVVAAVPVIEKLAGDDTTCPINQAGCVFSVLVSHPLTSQPIAGETVVWSNGAGETVNTMTNLRGIATTGNIAPNSTPGARTQVAQLESTGASVTFDYTLVPGGGYNIDIRFVGNAPTASVQAAFAEAKQRWEQVITGDVPDFDVEMPANVCNVMQPAVDEIVDDVLVFVSVDSIDGPGMVLGSAGPCGIRPTNFLPAIGSMRLDSADLAVLDANGRLRDVVMHELGHVLGLPALWGDSYYALRRDSATSNPYNIGARAFADFIVAGGTSVNGIGVPIENVGGAGTRNSHWRESVLATELMTGFISATSNPLSRITIGGFHDIGYQVNYGAADAYLLPGASVRAPGRPPALELIELPLPPPRIIP